MWRVHAMGSVFLWIHSKWMGEGKSIDRLGKDGRQSASFVWNETAVLLKGFDPCVKIRVKRKGEIASCGNSDANIALLFTWFVRGRSLFKWVRRRTRR